MAKLWAGVQCPAFLLTGYVRSNTSEFDTLTPLFESSRGTAYHETESDDLLSELIKSCKVVRQYDKLQLLQSYTIAPPYTRMQCFQILINHQV